MDELEEFKVHIAKELRFVFRSKINDHSLIYSAEVDCFEKYTSVHANPLDSDLLQGVELKTVKSFAKNTKQEQNFKKFKTLKWYGQSVLANMKKVSVGYWQENHVVNEIKEYSLDDLIAIGNWNPKVCFYQLDKILSFIKRCFASTKSTNLLRFEHHSFSKEVLCLPSKLVVVPEFYKREFA